jgi:hypothetical protein
MLKLVVEEEPQFSPKVGFMIVSVFPSFEGTATGSPLIFAEPFVEIFVRLFC